MPSHVCLCASARSRAFLHVSLFAVAPRVRLLPSQRKRMHAPASVCDAVPLLVSRQSDMRWPVSLVVCKFMCTAIAQLHVIHKQVAPAKTRILLPAQRMLYKQGGEGLQTLSLDCRLSQSQEDWRSHQARP